MQYLPDWQPYLHHENLRYKQPEPVNLEPLVSERQEKAGQTRELITWVFMLSTTLGGRSGDIRKEDQE